jgi:aminopeptidase
MDIASLKKYAEIVIKKGVNLYKDQCLNIETSVIDNDFALLLAEAAYKNGAKYVNINISTNELTKHRITYSNASNLDFIPQFYQARLNEQMAYDWAFIRIDNTGELDTFKDIDPTLLNNITKAERIARKRYLEECSKHKFAWCVIASINDNWASSVFNQPKSIDVTNKFWEILKDILRLNTDDPINAWEEHEKNILDRAGKLNDLNLEKLRLKSKETDLTVFLTKTSKWIGGPKKTPEGRSFIPNIPTEEVFTTPDYNKTSGYVKIGRPVKIMETLIKGIRLEFKNGKIVNFDAENDVAILEKFINTDSGSAYLGEIALVDKNSSIYKSGLIFNSILYDENASCHIALGNGYPSCLTNGRLLKSESEIKNAGCNVSMVHTDFMIDIDDINISGFDYNNKEHAIIKDGYFVI